MTIYAYVTSFGNKIEVSNGNAKLRRGCGRKCGLEIVQLTFIRIAECAPAVPPKALTDAANDARLP
eukprot:6204196-Pleurochrysis_carterae.AAC.2